jgi:hypothetical protein
MASESRWMVEFETPNQIGIAEVTMTPRPNETDLGAITRLLQQPVFDQLTKCWYPPHKIVRCRRLNAPTK